MNTVIEKQVGKIGRLLEIIASHVEHVGQSLDYISLNADEKNLFPTVKALRIEVKDNLDDLKGAVVQLENVDAELEKMETNESNQ